MPLSGFVRSRYHPSVVRGRTCHRCWISSSNHKRPLRHRRPHPWLRCAKRSPANPRRPQHLLGRPQLRRLPHPSFSRRAPPRHLRRRLLLLRRGFPRRRLAPRRPRLQLPPPTSFRQKPKPRRPSCRPGQLRPRHRWRQTRAQRQHPVRLRTSGSQRAVHSGQFWPLGAGCCYYGLSGIW